MSDRSPIRQMSYIIHSNNHTKTKRSCNINEAHLNENNIINNLIMTEDKSFTNLNPGIYSIEINNVIYIFDLYVSIIGPKEKLIIENPYNAYVQTANRKYLINLYAKEDTNTNNELLLNNTVNNYIDMIIIDGKTIEVQVNPSDISNNIAIVPKNNELPLSSNIQSIETKTIEELRDDNIIFEGLSYESNNIDTSVNPSSDPQIISYDNNYIENKDINDPYYLQSISRFNIITGREPLDITTNNTLEIFLKNNIKSLPNGVKDTFILNSEQCYNHIIYRTGRLVLSGAEGWKYISSLSNNDTWLYWLANSHVKLSNSNNNILCSHFNNIYCTNIVNSLLMQPGVSSGYGSYGNGIFLRINKSALINNNSDNDNTSPLILFKKWLFNEMQKGIPVTIEYELNKPIYNTVLIDEYHIKTYFPKTYIKLDNTYNVSYFYKTLKRLEE